jgi:hypothetical protein
MAKPTFNGLRVLSFESRRAKEMATLIANFGGSSARRSPRTDSTRSSSSPASAPAPSSPSSSPDSRANSSSTRWAE